MVLLICGMGYLELGHAQALPTPINIIDIPFSLGPGEVIHIDLVLRPNRGVSASDTVADPRDSACNVEVTFIDSDGTELEPKCERELRPGVPTSCDINPDPRPGGRNTYAAEVKVFGSDTGPWQVRTSLLIYNHTTGETMASVFNYASGHTLTHEADDPVPTAP